eukprot:101690-Prorocentrum_minimum.AAC.1
MPPPREATIIPVRRCQLAMSGAEVEGSARRSFRRSGEPRPLDLVGKSSWAARSNPDAAANPRGGSGGYRAGPVRTLSVTLSAADASGVPHAGRAAGASATGRACRGL